MRRVLLAAAAILAAGAGSGHAAGTAVYIVRMSDPPVAAYEGGANGLPSVPRTAENRPDLASAAAAAYAARLHGLQDAALAAIGGPAPLHRYDTTFNGFAVALTPAEVRALRAEPGVVSVTPDRMAHVDTISTGHFLGLDLPGGAWNQTVGNARLRGENVFIGVIDTGVQPEDPSFLDRVNAKDVPVSSGGTLAYGPPPARWKGVCQAGEGFTAATCNNKLVGARYFDAGFLAANLTRWSMEYVSPRDSDGHGSHTSSTAGGNANAPAVFQGTKLGAMTGMAPRARLAAYKVCWSYLDSTEPTGVGNGCYDSDSVAAIEQAVKDGVDVLNFSISGSQNSFRDPVEEAFRGAEAAGVFVATSAGNSGPGQAVAHPSPWLTTVAATTHDRTFTATLTLGDGQTFTGASHAKAVTSHPLVLAEAIPAAGRSTGDARYCLTGALDPAGAAGKVVVCDRGVSARLDKGKEVKRAGGTAMVLVNVPGGATGVTEDLHVLPAVHLESTAWSALHAYGSGGGQPTAALGAAVRTDGVTAPVMASFSSRGPSFATPFGLKPDIAAPGVAVIAGYAFEPQTQARHDAIAAGTQKAPAVVGSLDGTSMASPHVAGIAALVMQAHRAWTPAQVQSALITSARPVKLATGAADRDRFGYGAGNVNPNGAVDPGLVYPVSIAQYARYACGLQPVAGCDAVGTLAPTALNTASFSAPVAGKVVFERSVTNMSGAQRTFKGAGSMAGYAVSVKPASLTLGPGKTGKFKLTLTRTTAPLEAWRFGSFAWKAGQYVVRSPIAAIGKLLIATDSILSTTAKGGATITATYGFNGPSTVAVTRLVQPTHINSTVGNASQSIVSACLSSATGTEIFATTVDPGDLVLRYRLRQSDVGNPTDDIDLALFDAADTLVGYSGNAGSDEDITLRAPAPGTYRICIYGYAVANGATTYDLANWKAGPTTAGVTMKLTPRPTAVLSGQTIDFAASWDLSNTVDRYLAAVGYRRSGKIIGETLVEVDTSGASTFETAARSVAADR